MQSKEENNLIIARFFPGEDIGEGLKQVCSEHQVKTAVIISGLGQLADFSLGFFKEKGDYLPQNFTEPHELLSLQGLVSRNSAEADYEFHLHAVLGATNKTTVGGHFISGKVSVTAEIVLLKTDLTIKRALEEKTGLNGLFLE